MNHNLRRNIVSSESERGRVKTEGLRYEGKGLFWLSFGVFWDRGELAVGLLEDIPEMKRFALGKLFFSNNTALEPHLICANFF